MPTWFLYLLQCRSGSYYTGITTDVERRIQAHVQGKGAKYTRANPPVALLATRGFANRSDASKAEARVKRLPRHAKLEFFSA
jgi:putative endonuclease